MWSAGNYFTTDLLMLFRKPTFFLQYISIPAGRSIMRISRNTYPRATAAIFFSHAEVYIVEICRPRLFCSHEGERTKSSSTQQRRRTHEAKRGEAPVFQLTGRTHEAKRGEAPVQQLTRRTHEASISGVVEQRAKRGRSSERRSVPILTARRRNFVEDRAFRVLIVMSTMRRNEK